MPNSKVANQRYHAKCRALERYGLAFNRQNLIDIRDMIRSGKGVFIEKQSRRVSVWIVTYQEKPLKVVYDKYRGTVVTFLPLPKTDDERAQNG